MGSCMIYKNPKQNCIESVHRSQEIESGVGLNDCIREPGGPTTDDNGITYGNLAQDHSFRGNWEEKKSKKGFFSSLESCPTDSTSLIEIPIIDIKFISFNQPFKSKENTNFSMTNHHNNNNNNSNKEEKSHSMNEVTGKKNKKPNLKLYTIEVENSHKYTKASTNLGDTSNLSRQVMTSQGTMSRLRKSETIKEAESPDRGKAFYLKKKKNAL